MSKEKRDEQFESEYMVADDRKEAQEHPRKQRHRLYADDYYIDENGLKWKRGHKPKAADKFYVELGTTNKAPYHTEIFTYEDAVDLVADTVKMLGDDNLTEAGLRLLMECACNWITNRSVEDEFNNVSVKQFLQDADEDGHYADAFRIKKLLNVPGRMPISELKKISRRTFENLNWRDSGTHTSKKVLCEVFKARQSQGMWLQVFLKKHYNFNLGWYGEESIRLYTTLL